MESLWCHSKPYLGNDFVIFRANTMIFDVNYSSVMLFLARLEFMSCGATGSRF